MKSGPKSFTGRTRRHRTSWRVRASDFVARWLITIGGIGTIVAVLLVFLFLVAVVLPLFSPAKLTLAEQRATPWKKDASTPLQIGVDEYQTIGWALFPSGELQIYRIDNGDILERRPICEGAQLTAVSYLPAAEKLALGFADGSLRLGRIGFKSGFREGTELPDELRELRPGQLAAFEGGIIERTSQGQWRTQTVVTELKPPLEVATAAIRLIDHVAVGEEEETNTGKTPVLAVFSDDDKLQLVTTKKNPVTDAYKIDEQVALPLSAAAVGAGQATKPPAADQPASSLKPFQVLLSGRGDNVFATYRDGRVQRFDTRDTTKVTLAEEVRVVSDDAQLTACSFVLGRETLICGDSRGRVQAWFRIRDPDAPTPDGQKLVLVHKLKTGSSAVSTFGISQRSRLVATGFENGQVRIDHVTTERVVAHTHAAAGEPLAHVLLMPKENGLVAVSRARFARLHFDPKHPEATAASLFLPVWYEGYPEPQCVWQSSFAGVEPEMKLGLWPLIFGTLKATFYSLMFGVPLAMLAAIYSSEFLAPNVRAKVKPAIETMASLPSVVLGFLAALVLAPFIEQVVPAVLGCLIVMPFLVALAAFLWQLLPSVFAVRYAAYRPWYVLIVLMCGVVAGYQIGPTFESLFFAGDIQKWLNRQVGSGFGGWFVMLLPFAVVATASWIVLVVNPWLRGNYRQLSRAQFATLNLVKFLSGCLVAAILASLAAGLLQICGWDPRGSLVDTYVQRNALVVGFVMGFAIIPIIYTIAEDALHTVPQHLRSASLGAGATPWQTAFRVVIPTAMSGLFSAVMIGLGRAVGETMTVLMAGGNTPRVSLNPFDGFRTLSANIAVELPEAAPMSTHYRTLYFAALVLLVLTFVINTAAEVIRLRFRKRAFQL